MPRLHLGFAVMLTVLALALMQALSNELQHLNSPISTAAAIALIAMTGMLIPAALFGDAVAHPSRGDTAHQPAP